MWAGRRHRRARSPAKPVPFWALFVLLTSTAASGCEVDEPVVGQVADTTIEDGTIAPPNDQRAAEAHGFDAALIDALEPDVSWAKSDAREADEGSAAEVTPSHPCFKPSDCQKAAPETPYCKITQGYCVNCLVDFHCGGGDICQDGTCTAIECVPDETTCMDTFLATCNASGDGWNKSVCPEQEPHCLGGQCLLCKPSELFCALPDKPEENSKVLMKCAADGDSEELVAVCAPGSSCFNGACKVCMPGLMKCEGGKGLVCQSEGTGWQTNSDCEAKGLTCLGGLCVDPCGSDFRTNTNTNCEFWFADVGGDAACSGKGGLCLQEGTALILHSTKGTANVTIETDGTLLATVVIPKGVPTTVPLGGAGWTWPSAAVGKGPLALRINTTVPFREVRLLHGLVAGKPSSGTTLLNNFALTAKYVVAAWPQSEGNEPVRLAVVSKYATEVQVWATTSYRIAGTTKVFKPGVAALHAASGKHALVLESAVAGGDWTGTRIKGDFDRLAVFVQQTAHAPTTNRCVSGKCVAQGWPCQSDGQCPKTCCGDDALVQLRPTQALGKVHVAGRFQPRGLAKDIWRIVAAQDATVVTTLPAGASAVTLNMGQFLDIEAANDFVITSSKPTSVLHIMAGMFAPGPGNDLCNKSGPAAKTCAVATDSAGSPLPCADDLACPNLAESGDAKTGGPELLLVTPKNLWPLSSYGLCPPGFDAHFATIVADSKDSVQLDGSVLPASAWLDIGPTGGFKVARVPLAEGSHAIVSKMGVYVEWYGWSAGRSYGFAAMD